ncbi:copper amine oxidase 1 [Fusarium oxysporum f. sp. radicis-lycopersici 26381]|nr:copper amine oxidase 1 [Fusarium oxysporum f. sp. radicis-lycopersici 26381]RKK11898.1 Copper amine oxidase 1 [Fusarium oxysporum f. sp. cepae]RKK36470.1 Copper amine oxidase 1 [Fusarium oxysporum f. sp. cepae]RKK37558.1 Copper amine oxidase 1 [Fusarium oxysporum f. sp. cepae]RYC82520.1 Copper amine oxidase 1 [Fusarium oxysporum f. sp. narcissi]
MSQPHPLIPLSVDETNLARDVVRAAYPQNVLKFRVIYLEEPVKEVLAPYLDLEHAGKVTSSTPRPSREARVHFDTAHGGKPPQSHEAIIDLNTRKIKQVETIRADAQAAFTSEELDDVRIICRDSPVFKERIAKFNLPQDFEVVVEPWPYGGLDAADDPNRRHMQALIYASDSKNRECNFWGYPLPIIPVIDAETREVIRIHEVATGGGNDPHTFAEGDYAKVKIDHMTPSEYVPELLPGGLRRDLKELNVVQPSGPSFNVEDSNVINWQKWSMRATFNPREGAVLHDVRFDGRSVLYRLSISDMTVPYADPRPPFHRKQAFDFGDGTLGDACNNLQLGCDCLGVIKYFDGVLVDHSGTARTTKNVICLHEQDNGINWKHTNWRTGRAVVTRRRELVVQFIITLANYEYIFNYIFDQAGAITVQARATGIVSSVLIEEGKTAPWGNVVSPGILAQNHQHIFCVRIDPAIDGHKNTLVQTESLPMRIDARTNPNGNAYQVVTTPVTASAGLDANPFTDRTFKVQNMDKLNPISGQPVGYKILAPVTRPLLADPNSTQAKRARFAQRHLWVTKHRDNEFYAGGRYTLQSVSEVEGVADAADRNDDVFQQDIVLWSVFGLTHNPRVEDWPVMPVEILDLHIKPADFFTANPAIDVPGRKNFTSQLTNAEKAQESSCCADSKPRL